MVGVELTSYTRWRPETKSETEIKNYERYNIP